MIARRLRAVLAGLALAAVTVAPLVQASTAAARGTVSFIQVQNDVMCVACHEPLAVAQSPEAFSERAYIRQLIAQGMTKTRIEKELVAQYGEAVLAKPPARGFNLVIYILPPAVLLIGLATLAYTLPKWRRSSRRAAAEAASAPPPPMDAEDARRLREDLARQA
ncbi:MAG: cytochrome c-type biogenesis protein CcmH [Solirubrobacteraceae bacterium]